MTCNTLQGLPPAPACARPGRHAAPGAELKALIVTARVHVHVPVRHPTQHVSKGIQTVSSTVRLPSAASVTWAQRPGGGWPTSGR
jgi:hypothetical protein